MPFQTVMNAQPAPGIEGDWASANPRFSQLTQAAPVFAGPGGITVGRFAWLNGNVYSQPFLGGRIAFIHRDQPSLIYPFALAGANAWPGPQASMMVPQGLEVVGFDSADVWVRFAAGATIGQSVYANYADGTAVAITGATSPTTATASSSAVVATTTLSCTGGINGNILTVSVLGAGNLYPGSILAGSGGANGVAVITGTQVLAQITPLLSGEAVGGVGRYFLNFDYGVSTVQSSTITGSIGIMTVTTTSATTIGAGPTISQTGISAGTQITAGAAQSSLLTGAGGAGTYAVTPSQTGGTGTATFATNVATNWLVDTYAASGELAKISRHG